MAKGNEGLEWRISITDGTSRVLSTECSSSVSKCFRVCTSPVIGFMQRAWQLAVSEPKKVIHCFKVGLALSLVSLFYYMRPLYEGVGGNAMWAVMTVVVVFEYTIGSTLYKCVNRIIGTGSAGALALGVHWIAGRSGEQFEPVILQGSVFLLAAAATFSRFIPSIKARFDYGALIFILTFSLVSVSGYRVEKLFELAHSRLSTIAIGTSICLLTTMLICPVWAGTELHNLVKNNMEKLADSLDGHVVGYFMKNECEKFEAGAKKLQGHKCVLNSKATEESLANFARWEPAHGAFQFSHPWQTYPKLGASLRRCAYLIEAINGSINSGSTEAPSFLKSHFSDFCVAVGADSSAVLKELALVMSTMTRSTKIDLLLENMSNSVQQLQNALNGQILGDTENVNAPRVSLADIVALVTVSSLLIEVTTRVVEIKDIVDGWAEKAELRSESAEKPKKSQNNNNTVNPISEDNGEVKAGSGSFSSLNIEPVQQNAPRSN